MSKGLKLRYRKTRVSLRKKGILPKQSEAIFHLLCYVFLSFPAYPYIHKFFATVFLLTNWAHAQKQVFAVVNFKHLAMNYLGTRVRMIEEGSCNYDNSNHSGILIGSYL